MLRWRVTLGLLLIALLVGACVADISMPGIWLGIVSLVIPALASGEAVGLARASGLKPLRAAGSRRQSGDRGQRLAATGLLAASAGWAVHRWLLSGPLPCSSFASSWRLLIEIIRYLCPSGLTARLAGTMWPLLYVGLLFSFLVLVRSLSRGAAGVGYLLALVTVVKMGDTGAYFVGRLIGRHKMPPPYLSPGKTIEGAIGGLAFSSFGAWLVLVCLWPRYFESRAWGPAREQWLPLRPGQGGGRHGGRLGRVAVEA